MTVHPNTIAAARRDGTEFREHRAISPTEKSPVSNLKSWRIWYDDLLEYILANPGCSMQSAADYVGKHVNWIRLLVRSDSFQAALAKRRDERMDEVRNAIGGRLARTALTALDVLDEKLSKHRTNIPIEKVTEAVDVTLERLGYGTKPQPQAAQTNVQINVGADPSAVAAARASLRAAEQARLIDRSEGPPRLVPPADESNNRGVASVVEAAPSLVGSTAGRALESVEDRLDLD